MNVRPVTLTGDLVRLEPLTIEHAASLAKVGLDPELWRLQPATVASAEDMRAYVESALGDERSGVSLPFAILDRASGAVIGSTRYMDIARPHRRLEIGATWLSPAWQRTGANTEAKLLLLTHAFESLRALRVVLKTETLNARSRAAILRIGAVEEGTFRGHLLTASGRPRDMVYFSILDTEWPGVRRRLETLLRQRGRRGSSGETATERTRKEGSTAADSSGDALAPPDVRILAVSGSLRAASSNRNVLRALVRLAPPGTSVELHPPLDGLPFFNPDVEESGLPPAVAAWRRRIGQSDAVLISSPEYAHGVPGVLKNALDWLVGGIEISGKPIAVVNARPESTIAHAALVETLRIMGGRVVREPALPAAARKLDERGIASDPSLAAVLRSTLSALIEAAGAPSHPAPPAPE